MAFNSKFLIIIFIQLIFCQKSYSDNFYNFNYLLCDSLKNANYNFGIKNSKKNLVIYKLKGQSFKKTKIKKDANSFMVNLDKLNHFQKPIYLNFLSNHFYLSENDMFLGGCFVVKNEGILKCKLQSYYNVFNGKLPLACN
jgi:hypothetical protein